MGKMSRKNAGGVAVYIKGINVLISVGGLSKGESGRKFRVVHHWGLLKGC